MTNYSAKSVSDFIKTAPKEARSHLAEIRAAVKLAIPKAAEMIGYGKPYYKTTRWIVGYDFYKNHVTFEIWNGQLSSDIRKKLEEKGYKTGNKTFQIRYDQKVPIGLVKTITKNQAKAEANIAMEKESSKKR